MKRIISIIGIISILAVLSANLSGTQVTAAKAGPSSSDSNPVSKIGSSLSMHIKMKQTQAGIENQDIMTTCGLDSPSAGEITPVDREKVFLHFKEPPTSTQIEELNSMGVTVYPDSWVPPVNSFKTGFVLADAPVDSIYILAARSYIMKLDTAERKMSLMNDQAREYMDVDPVWDLGYTGAGVTVAVIDSGLDTGNEDFPEPIAAVDYSRYPESIDYSVKNTATGHGTHVTGSLLGRGNNSSTYKGVAPGADLVFIKVGKDNTGEATASVVIGAIMAAVDVYQVDIINFSLGNWSDYHDGSDEVCQAADYATSQGIAFFAAAGNWGNDDWHIFDSVDAHETTDYYTLRVDSESSGSHLAANLVWQDGLNTHNNLTLHYYDSKKKELSPSSGTQSESTRSGVESRYYWFEASRPSGTYYLRVTNNSDSYQDFHVYYVGDSYDVTFDNSNVEYTITSPAEADTAMAVSSIVSRSEWTNFKGNTYYYDSYAASHSHSCGPRIDEALKPDITAPGSAIISVRDSFYSTSDNDYIPLIIDNDGIYNKGSKDYIVMQGTSMASPMAAGVAALLLQKDPSLTPAQIKHILEKSADTGYQVHDTGFGWGEINADQALDTGTVLRSYSNAQHTSTCTDFVHYATHTAYMRGTGYLNGLAYKVAYYDGSNNNAATEDITSTISGTIDSQHTFVPGTDAAGTWHVIMCEATFTPPDTYTDDWPYTIVAAEFTVQSTAINPVLVFGTEPQTLVAGTVSDVITLCLQDGDGDPVDADSDKDISLSSDSPQGKFYTSADGAFETSSVTLPAGENQIGFYYMDTKAGTPVITADSQYCPGVQQTETVIPAEASQIVVETAADGSGNTGPQNIAAGSSLTVYAVTRDAYGNLVGNADGDWSLVNKDGVEDADLTAGQDKLSATFTGHALGSAQIHVETDGLVSVDSGTITVVPKFGLTADTPCVAGASWNFTLSALDGYDIQVGDYSGIVHFTSSDSQADLPEDYEFTPENSGTHIFDVKLKTSGTQSIIATDIAIPETTGQTEISITAAGAYQVGAETAADGSGNTGPLNVVAGDSITLYAVVRDAYGNFVDNRAGTWSLIAVSGEITDTDLVANASGLSAVFTGRKTGSANIRAAISGLETVDSALVIVAGGAAAGLTVSGFPASITVSKSGNFDVTALDLYSNIAAGYRGTVHFTSSDSEAELPPDYAFTESDNGTHSFEAVFKTTGTQSITASDTSVSSLSGSQENIEVKPKSSGGGGGGGGGGGSTSINLMLNGLVSTTTLKLDSQGRIQSAGRIQTADGNVTIDIARGTKLLTEKNTVLSTMTTGVLESPPALPNSDVLLSAYSFGPDGAKFDPAISLSMTYDPAGLPENVSGQDLYIAFHDGVQWQSLDSTVDAQTATVNVKITHFSSYALIAEVAPPAKFIFSDMSVSSSIVKPDEAVSVQTTVTNSGGCHGECKITLRINGVDEASRTVALDASQMETVIFSIKKNRPGEYNLDIGGQTSSFTVEEPQAEPSASPETGLEPPATGSSQDKPPDLSDPTLLPQSTTPAKPEGNTSLPSSASALTQAPDSAPANDTNRDFPVLWVIIGIIIAAIVAVTAIVTIKLAGKSKSSNIR
ncbi:MAG: S8 family serine peptidase [Dehalococcoidales bacterium]|nr:S8 family serine peptidase [Dehalococcoidales bacterium]